LIKRVPELEALIRADEVAVANDSVRRNQLFSLAALVGAGVIAAYFVFARHEPALRDELDSDEEFSTSVFRPPSFIRDGEVAQEAEEPEIITLPPPPPPPKEEALVPSEFEVPPPEQPALASAPEAITPIEEFPERFRSNMVVLNDKKETGEGAPSGNGESRPTVAGQDSSSKFLAAAAGLGDRGARARKVDRIDALIAEGTLIPGILETAIVSDLPGQVRAIVSKDVHSFDGRRVLIPAGTRLIGEYQSEVIHGQQRIFVIWTRLLRDDGVSARLDSIGADSLGRSGLGGHVDKKFRERFGAAIVLSVVGGAASYLTGYGSNDSGNDDDDVEVAEETARSTIAETFSEMANQVLGNSLKIPPTISISQGERIFVFVRQDLDFSSLYPDPVAEALMEIRRERGLR
jgi:type IV secretion system protein VirB10